MGRRDEGLAAMPGLRAMGIALLMAGGVATAPAPAWAHVLKLYAEVAGDDIRGEAYFSTGSVPVNVPVQVFLPGRRKIGEVLTDEHGKFTFHPTVRQNHTFTIDAGEGHRGEWTIETDELPASLPSK